MDGWLFFGVLAFTTFGHNGLMEAASKVFWKLINLVIAVNFNGFLGGVHYHVAFLAPMEMFVQLNSKAFGNFAIKVISQLL
jgi:hypothetical protein